MTVKAKAKVTLAVAPVSDVWLLGELHGTLHSMVCYRTERKWLEDEPMDALIGATMLLALEAAVHLKPIANAYGSGNVFTYEFVHGAAEEWSSSECLPAYLMRALSDEEWGDLVGYHLVTPDRIKNIVQEWATTVDCS